MGKKMSKTLHFLSPLQSLTLFPKDDVSKSKTPREEFLPKFRAGLAAEGRVRDTIARESGAFDGDDGEEESTYVGDGWEKRSEEDERRKIEGEEERAEGAFDNAAAIIDRSSGGGSGEKVAKSKYQFVGVVQSASRSAGGGGKSVKWYAKKRPSGSKWNVRLVHVNREAIIKDLFGRGKVDIYGEYVNTGKSEVNSEDGGNTPMVSKPLIEGRYTVKERSWRTLWNRSPKHFFTDSSGAFWRDRRLNPGLYTDGRVVYESRYRYTDGKNGMKPIALLDSLLKSKSIKKKVKVDLLKRLKDDSPDVVIEE